ncbi:UNVERIFIED_CONTAM: hypothetical protein RMT77_003954 [Armadillidium vulgare]
MCESTVREDRKYETDLNRFQEILESTSWKKVKTSSFTFPQRTIELDWVCVGVSSGFRCGFCGMSVLCAGGKAYKQPCPPSTSCTLRPEFSGAVCHTSIPTGCRCRGLNELRPDPYNPSAYIFCSSRSRFPRRIELCPNSYYFNVTTSTCQKIPQLPSCITIGTFPLPSDCSWYYTCNTDAFGNWVQLPSRCMSPDTVYSTSYNGCTDPYSLPSTDICSANAKPPQSKYICTLFGLIVTSIFPSFVNTFCHKITR